MKRARSLFGEADNATLIGRRAWDLPGRVFDEASWNSIAAKTCDRRIWRDRLLRRLTDGDGPTPLDVSATRRVLGSREAVIVLRMAEYAARCTQRAEYVSRVQSMLRFSADDLSANETADAVCIAVAHALSFPLVCAVRRRLRTGEIRGIGICQGAMVDNVLSFKNHPAFADAFSAAIDSGRPAWFDPCADVQVGGVERLTSGVHVPLFCDDRWAYSLAMLVPQSAPPEASTPDLLEIVGGVATVRFQSGAMRSAREAGSRFRHRAVFAYDHEGRIRFWNEACSDFLGVRAADAVGRPFWRIGAPLLAEAADESAVAELFATGRWPNRGKAADPAVRFFPLNDSVGRVSLGICCATERNEFEPTERHPSGFGLNGRENRLDAKWIDADRRESIGAVARNSAREISDQVARVVGGASVLKRRFAGDPECESRTRAICDAAESIARTVNRFLTFAEQDADRFGSVNVNDVVRETLAFVRPGIPARLDLSVCTNAKAGTVYGSAARLSQLLMLLVDNARDAVDAAGRIAVEIAAVDADEVPGGPARGSESWVALRVVDSGPGVADAWRERIFDPLFTTRPERRGFGLAIAREIVRAHGGAIAFDRTPDGEARFTAYLPTGRKPDATRTDFAVSSLLVISPDPALRALIVSGADALGHRILTAETAKGATAVIERRGAILDLVMLDTDLAPVERVAAARGLRSHPDLPVLLVAAPGEIDERFPKPAGMLIKPFGFGALKRAIRHHARKSAGNA